jgi:hypothetical protein
MKSTISTGNSEPFYSKTGQNDLKEYIKLTGVHFPLETIKYQQHIILRGATMGEDFTKDFSH